MTLDEQRQATNVMAAAKVLCASCDQGAAWHKVRYKSDYVSRSIAANKASKTRSDNKTWSSILSNAVDVASSTGQAMKRRRP